MIENINCDAIRGRRQGAYVRNLIKGHCYDTTLEKWTSVQLWSGKFFNSEDSATPKVKKKHRIFQFSDSQITVTDKRYLYGQGTRIICVKYKFIFLCFSYLNNCKKTVTLFSNTYSTETVLTESFHYRWYNTFGFRLQEIWTFRNNTNSTTNSHSSRACNKTNCHLLRRNEYSKFRRQASKQRLHVQLVMECEEHVRKITHQKEPRFLLC